MTEPWTKDTSIDNNLFSQSQKNFLSLSIELAGLVLHFSEERDQLGGAEDEAGVCRQQPRQLHGIADCNGAANW